MPEALAHHPAWDKIDAILVINLDTSVDRMERFLKENASVLPLEKVQRLSAVYGRSLPTYGKLPWFTENTGDRAGFWAGTAGCALSHRKAIEKARSEGWRNVLILEDDARIIADHGALDMLEETICSQPEDYMLYLGFNRPEPYGRLVARGASTSLWRVEGVLATHAYLLPGSMYDKVLALLPDENNVWEWLTRYRAIDSMYRDYLSAAPGVRILAFYPVLVEQGSCLSDIGGAAGGGDEYACKCAPLSYCSISGLVHLMMAPLHRLKVHLNSMRTYCRGRRTGLPGYRKRRKK